MNRKTRKNRQSRKSRKQRGRGMFGSMKESMKASMPQFNTSFSMKNSMKQGVSGFKGYMNQTRRNMSNGYGQMRKGISFKGMKNEMFGRPYNGGVPGT